MIFTCARPDFVESAMLVAETVAVLGEGAAVGAVYSPAALIVPTTDVPPGVPLTAHETAGLKAPVPVTVAVNCCVVPVCTEAEGGLTETDVMLG